jgi:hypothetical protein
MIKVSALDRILAVLLGAGLGGVASMGVLRSVHGWAFRTEFTLWQRMTAVHLCIVLSCLRCGSRSSVRLSAVPMVWQTASAPSLLVMKTQRSSFRDAEGNIRIHTSEFRDEVTEFSEETLGPDPFVPPRDFRRVGGYLASRPSHSLFECGLAGKTSSTNL